ncbi:hypothetical protein [Corynebacterium parakroppenstedtii]|uniref:hypothetical protein n=1 Tax=Corynebacterium parakroppenstedtii TaxID=2828363 RepID=UPI0030EF0EB7
MMQVLDRLSLTDVSTGTRWLVDLMVVLALWMDALQPVFGAATAMVWCIVTPYGNPRLLAYRAFGLTIVRYVRDYVLIAVARSVALVLVGGLIGVLVRRGIAGWSLPPFLGSSRAESVTPFIVYLLVVAFAGVVLGLGFNAFAGSRTMSLRQYSGLGGAQKFEGDHYAESTFVSEGAGLSDLMVELCGGRSSAETPRTEEEQHNLTWHFLPTRETWWKVFAVALLLCGISFSTSSMITLVVGLLVTCALVGFVLVAIAWNASSFGVPRAIMWRKNSVLALGQAAWIAVLFIITAVSIAS